MTKVLVRGTGDVGSAVAHVLHRAGYEVVLHDEPRPAHSRRGMAFTDALFDGVASLEGVLAKRTRRFDSLEPMLQCRRAIPIVDEPFQGVLEALRPQVLVDARMRKRAHPESQRGLAALTIGLGPNFVAALNADLVIETAWGDELGTVKRAGGARPLSGDPNPIEGHSRDRFVYAPSAGRFRTQRSIGDRVERGDPIGTIDGLALPAPLSGVIRGLVHDGVEVSQGAKLVEVDPRGEPGAGYGLGERPKRIATGVLRALQESGF